MSMYSDPAIDRAIQKIAEDFPRLRWEFSPKPGNCELVSHWLGEEGEDVMVNVFKGKRINEQFHRQDFFFLHFAWQGDYGALSANYNNLRAVALRQNASGAAAVGSHRTFHRKDSRHAGLQ